METELFGTDGIRGKAQEGILVPESLVRLGRAIGSVAIKRRMKRVALLGNDGRRSAGMIGDSLAAGLMASGFDVVDVGLISTPGLAWLTGPLKAGLGVMISASHNPAGDNGIKLFGTRGSKLPVAVERAIEKAFDRKIFRQPKQLGQRRQDSTALKRYQRHLKSSVPGLKLGGMKIVLDCANGGASIVGPALLESLGAKVIPVATAPNGDNINKRCGALYAKAMAGKTRRSKARIGIALDGDADRTILADEKGRVVDGDGIMTVLAKDLHGRGKLAKKTMVATVMSNLGLHHALKEAGIKVRKVGVGDKQVSDMLRKRGYSLGGEQSGHIIFGKDNDFIGDGLYTALRVLDAMKRNRKPLSGLAAPFRRFPQVLRNVKVSNKLPFKQNRRIMDVVRRIEKKLGGSGRVLLRYSGTEPLARVMVEGPDLKQIKKMAEEIALTLQRELP